MNERCWEYRETGTADLISLVLGFPGIKSGVEWDEFQY